MIPTPWSSHKKKTMEKILSKRDEPFSSSLFASLQRWYLWLNVERVTGIEPAWSAWKAGALPLSYTREVIYLSRGKGSGNPKARTARSDLPPNSRLR